VNVVDRLFGWVANCGLGTRIDRFADLFGVTIGRSHSLMLERVQVCCRMEDEQLRGRG